MPKRLRDCGQELCLRRCGGRGRSEEEDDLYHDWNTGYDFFNLDLPYCSVGGAMQPFTFDCLQRFCMCRERVGGRSKESLYLIVDDWKSGFSFRKIDLPSGSDGGAVQRLPPAFLRMVVDRETPEYFTTGFGSKILMMQPNPDGNPILLIDINMLVILPGPEMNVHSNPIYIPIGSDKLFVMSVSGSEICSLSKPDQGIWSWSELQKMPFSNLDISSYAVDYQEQTVFVSTNVTTFTFDIGKSVWEEYGDWVMPFNGRGYYVRGLDGFVGISKHPETLGYLYFCDMTTQTGTGSYLDMKCSKVKVFNKNPAAERHLAATLVYMHHCKFCIVECVSIDQPQELIGAEASSGSFKADQSKEMIGAEASSGSFQMYRVITFTIRFDKRTNLVVKNYRVRCYEVPHEASSVCINANPVAYWL